MGSGALLSTDALMSNEEASPREVDREEEGSSLEHIRNKREESNFVNWLLSEHICFSSSSPWNNFSLPSLSLPLDNDFYHY